MQLLKNQTYQCVAARCCAPQQLGNQNDRGDTGRLDFVWLLSPEDKEMCSASNRAKSSNCRVGTPLCLRGFNTVWVDKPYPPYEVLSRPA